MVKLHELRYLKYGTFDSDIAYKSILPKHDDMKGHTSLLVFTLFKPQEGRKEHVLDIFQNRF